MGSLLNKIQGSQQFLEKIEEGGISHLSKSNVHNKQPSFILISFEMFKLYYWNFTIFNLLPYGGSLPNLIATWLQ